MRKLVFATTNPGKAREFAQLLSDMPYDVVALSEYANAPEVEEDGATFEENAIIKATAYAAFTGELTLADDSGLEVDALNGAPGVLSSRFAEDDAARNAKLMMILNDVPDEKRSARFRCAVAIAMPDGNVRTCSGTLEGTIAQELKGTKGFGYDPLFFLPELGKHLAELDDNEKHAISHRGKAMIIAKEILIDIL